MSMRARRTNQGGVGPHGLRRSHAPEPGLSRAEVMTLLALGVFVVALVVGYAWSLDRQLRGGLLRQHAEAAARPDWVRTDTLPAHVLAAFVTVVDPYFEEREGFALETEQMTMARDLVRQVHRLGGAYDGRARELVMAPLLENHLSRQGLLDLYLNRVFLGREGEWPVFGVMNAAREYYNKDARDLTLSEAAALAGLLLPPRIERPHDMPGAVGIRRQEVLREMSRRGLISPEQHAAATAEPLGFQPGVAFAPMARPVRWHPESRPLRLPPDRRPAADTVPAT
jgi:membrane peptidoglycan carboxypeptidase